MLYPKLEKVAANCRPCKAARGFLRRSSRQICSHLTHSPDYAAQEIIHERISINASHAIDMMGYLSMEASSRLD